MAVTAEKNNLKILAPDMRHVTFLLKGSAPLVIHRFSAKTKMEMKLKMETGKPAASSRNREARSTDDIYNEARYIADDGWDGCHAAAFRNAMISACRLVGFKMTLAKLSFFVIEDGRDRLEPQIPLVRIYGEPKKQEDIARVSTGQPYVAVRPAFHDWTINLRIRYDAGQFTIGQVGNLLTRVGMQVGIGEGRPDSKNSAGMGWGLFDILQREEGEVVAA